MENKDQLALLDTDASAMPHLEDVDTEIKRVWDAEYRTWESVEERDLTFGEKLSDRVAVLGGSWLFVASFCGFVGLWALAGLLKLSPDGYPFILLNLILSLIAALQAPIIMMSQRRQEDKDRARAKLDFELSRKAEMEVLELRQICESLLKELRQRR